MTWPMQQTMSPCGVVEVEGEARSNHHIVKSVQAILVGRGERQALKRGHPSDYLFSGVLRGAP